MTRLDKFLIDGVWRGPVNGGVDFPIINPATEAAVGSVTLGGVADAEAAIEAAATAFPAFANTPVKDRIDLLKAILAVHDRRLDEMADAITTEMGAPLETLSRPDQAALGPIHLKTTIKAASKFAFDEQRGGTLVTHEPVGVCALITPWNWPLNQIACKVAPALAAGCAMVLKPSELAPLSAQLFAEILVEAGVPAGVFNMFFADGAEVGPTLAGHPLVDMVSLTGSTRAGASVSHAAADGIKRVSLELGGKSANIVAPSADLARAVTHGVGYMMSNTGQSCNAPTRLFVPRDRLAEAEAAAAAVCAGLVVGDPRDPKTTIGPIANQRQYERVLGFMDRAMEEGARLVCGGPGRPDGLARGYFVKPTVFSDVTDTMTIARDEVFGPVLSILAYDTLDEAIERANASIYGLSGHVHAGTIEEARDIARRLRTGMVHLNGSSIDINGPFGGFKQSGLGREWGAAGLEEFLETKAMFGAFPR